MEDGVGAEGVLLVTVNNPTLATGDKAHAIVLQNGKQAERSHDQYKGVKGGFSKSLDEMLRKTLAQCQPTPAIVS